MASSAAPVAGQDDSAASFIGALISLTSHSNIRYQGILSNIDATQATLSLEKGHPQDEVPKNDYVYDYIVFRAADVVDLRIDDPYPSKTGGVDQEKTETSSSEHQMASAPGQHDAQYMMQNPYAPMAPYGSMYQPMPPMYGGFGQEAYSYGGYMAPQYMGHPIYPASTNRGFDLPPHMQGIPTQPPMYGTPNLPMTSQSSAPDASTQTQSQSQPSAEVPESNKAAESGTDVSQSKNPELQNKSKSQLPANEASVSDPQPMMKQEVAEKKSEFASPNDASSSQPKSQPITQERQQSCVSSTAAPSAVATSHAVNAPMSDFDFERANARFQKHTGPEFESGAKAERMTSVPPISSNSFYDRKTGFFDNISSEVKDRHEGGDRNGRGVQAEEKERNILTFGDQAANFRGSSHRGRGRNRGGRGRGRGRGEKRPDWA